MFYFVALLPVVFFLILNPLLSVYLSKNDRYRTNSVQGFRSTKAVKNPENWRKAQLLTRKSSFFFGFAQLLLTFGIAYFGTLSEGVFLLATVAIMLLFIIVQFLYVDHRLD